MLTILALVSVRSGGGGFDGGVGVKWAAGGRRGLSES